MKLIRQIGLLAVILTVSVTAALAGGMFQNYPVVGASATAFCSLFGGNGTTCVEFTPAGPSVVTGNELVPADTQLANGSSPQTVRLPMAALNALPYQYATPLAAATVVSAKTTGTMLLDPAGTLATLTVTLPPSPIDGQHWNLASSQTITALTLNTSDSSTISNNPTVLTVSTTTSYGYTFVYRAANTKWFRAQ